MSELHFIGVPFNSDGTRPELEHPPQHLRKAGLLDRLDSSRWLHLDVDVIDADLMPVIFPAGAGLTFAQAETVLAS